MTQAGKPLYLVGNWKSHKTLQETEEFLTNLNLPELALNQHVVLCPPYPYLHTAHEVVESRNLTVSLGVQDISHYPLGAYTGAVAGAMVKQVAKFAIVGHSERRKYFHETNQDVAAKARATIDNEMTPIVCVDVPYLETQLAFFTQDELQQMIVAYEPVSAIGSGIPDTPLHAEEVASTVRRLAQTDVPILYGGSVTADSVQSFIQQESINGVLVGGASLDPLTWASLVTAALS